MDEESILSRRKARKCVGRISICSGKIQADTTPKNSSREIRYRCLPDNRHIPESLVQLTSRNKVASSACADPEIAIETDNGRQICGVYLNLRLVRCQTQTGKFAILDKLRFRVRQGFDGVKISILPKLHVLIRHWSVHWGLNLPANRALRMGSDFAPEVSHFRKAVWCLSFRRSFVTMHGN